jgi:hypothetical protein
VVPAWKKWKFCGFFYDGKAFVGLWLKTNYSFTSFSTVSLPSNSNPMLKILHLILALNILLSSSGIMVFEHLCQMRGKKIALFVQPKSCCQKRVSCCAKAEVTNTQESLSRIPCCSDKSSFLKTDTQPTLQKVLALSLVADAFILPPSLNFALEFSRDILPHNQKILRFYLYKPPPRMRDIPVLVQSFLC